MAKQLVQIVIQSLTVVGRAFGKAVREEIKFSQQAASRAGGGAQAQKAAASDLYHGMSLQEARQIINVEESTEAEIIEQKYQHLMKLNDKKAGGSFYLQSKIYRAKERIDQDLIEKSAPPGSESKSP